MRRDPFRFLLAVLMTCTVFSLVIGQASAQTSSLKEVERDLSAAKKKTDRLKRESEALSRSLRTVRREMVRAASAVRTREAEMIRTEARLSEIIGLERDKLKGLKLDEGGLARVLAALVRMTRNPPGALLLQDIRPSDAVRGAILLRAAVPAIEERTGRLHRDLTELAHARVEANNRRIELARLSDQLGADRARLETLFKKKLSLKSETDTEQKTAEARARQLARKAESLRDLLIGLERGGAKKKTVRLRLPPPKMVSPKAAPSKTMPKASPSTPPAARSISEARGLLPFPVIGRIMGSYGDKLESGLRRKGIVIVAQPQAQIIAPFDGRVVFAGPFRGYGRLLIIDHGEGYHSLLAGMARIDTRVGQDVLAGEPVGIMGQPPGRDPGLYVEFRRDSQPINPTPWLQAQADEVTG